MRVLAAVLLGAVLSQAVAVVHEPTRSRAVMPRANASTCKLTASNGGYVGGALHEGFGPSTSCTPSRGVLSGFMFFVDFSDYPASNSGNDAAATLKEFFAPSVEWYTNSSFGRLNFSLTIDFAKFYRMPGKASTYNLGRGTITTESHLKYIRDAAEAYLSGGGKALATTPDVLYVVPTRNARTIEAAFTTLTPIRSRSGVVFSKLSAITTGMNTYTHWQYKVINHETGHALCLPDLYPSTGSAGGFVGGWDLMGYIKGTGPDYFAWHKWKLGWIDDAQVDCLTGRGSTTHTVYPIELKGGFNETKAVVVKRNNTMALVAEVRAKTGVDITACATGVVLYTVQNANSRGRVSGPIRVIDSTPRSGGCGGEELSDGTLTLERVKALAVPGWNVTVSVTEKVGDAYRVKVDVY
ncbi:hypothetical protein QBC34DRAFT_455668 [Podospora aff. communis PSN243]|uniref:M6 metalloprotease n=1 Tax=Podospora aff. communis PSN243 TaxID=3040156 RepID=A0AAV9GVN5_9PEZI|nr:hypothetical protein QBC34DRAFT_455668 [Podospora aff. communis PSN243]